jgi:hypothetical protein
MKTYVVATVLASSRFSAMQVYGDESSGAVKDAWIDGKLEAV